MHTREKYWASKVPVPLALLFLLNVVLIVAGELLLFYKHPAVVDEASIGKVEPSLVSSTIYDQDERGQLVAYLLRTPDGENKLLVVKQHPIVYGRGKVIYLESVELLESNEMIIPVKNGIRTAEIAIQDIPSGPWSVTVQFVSSGTVKETAVWYMVLAALLEALELMVIHFIKNRLQ